MKKLLVTTFATTCMAFGALAQGSVNVDTYLSNFGGDGGITTQGTGATSTSLSPSSPLWYNNSSASGNNFSLEVFFSTTATSTEATTIDSFLNQSGGAASAMALFAADGFTEADAGATLGNVSQGAFNFSGGGTILLPNVTTSAVGYYALVATAVGGATDGYEGVIAFSGNAGGNPAATPSGSPATLTGWNTLDENLVLSPVPEPATLAVAGLGGLSMLLIRRRK